MQKENNRQTDTTVESEKTRQTDSQGSRKKETATDQDSAAAKAMSFSKKFAKKTAKSVYLLSGVDAIFKNARYMKPRNPRIWGELFSREAFRQGVSRFKNPRLQKGGWKVIASLVLSIGISLLTFFYSYLFIASHPDPGALPMINKIVLMAFMIFGAVTTFIYSTILVIRISRLAKAAQHSKTGAKS